MPVLLVLVSAGQSRTTSAGRVRTGLVLLRTVMVWTQLRLLPPSSIAVHVRAMTLAPAQLLLTESLKLIVTSPHPSVAVATPVTFVVGNVGHSSVAFVGQMIA